MNNTVYHYCSVDTFLKIITNKELWLTDVTKSNDSKELQLVFDKLTDELEQRTNAQNFNDNFVPLSLFKEFLLNFKSTELLYHVCCFSKDADSLNQWSMYADNATGIAIGFDSTYFSKLKNYNNHISFCKVEYSLDSFIKKLYNKIEQLTKMYKNAPENDYSWFIEFVRYIIDDILKITYIYKNASFYQEHEYRLVYNSKPCIVCNTFEEDSVSYNQEINNHEIDFSCGAVLKNISYYKSRGKLITYRPLHFNNMNSIINEIVIGPKSLVTEHDIEMLLISNGIDLPFNKIKKSFSTYQ